jgi:hypothetical protein
MGNVTPIYIGCRVYLAVVLQMGTAKGSSKPILTLFSIVAQQMHEP